MFPNVRLLIGALFASIVALSCGFGVFAAFRVNHEPLSRISFGGTPVQLVANDIMVPRSGWGTPFADQSNRNAAPNIEPVSDVSVSMSAKQAAPQASNPVIVSAIEPAAATDAPAAGAGQPAETVVTTIRENATTQATVIEKPVVAVSPAAQGTAVSPVTPSPVATAAPERATPEHAATSPPIAASPDQTKTASSPPAEAAAPAASVTVPDASAPMATVAPPAAAATTSRADAPPPATSMSVNTPSVASPSATVPQKEPSAPASAETTLPPGQTEPSEEPIATVSNPPASSPVPSSAPVLASLPPPASPPDARRDTNASPAETSTPAKPTTALVTEAPEQPAAITAPDQEPGSAPGTASSHAKAAAKPVHKIIIRPAVKTAHALGERRRVAKKRIVRRLRARAIARTQDNGFSNPVFQTAPGSSRGSSDRSASSGW